MALDIGTERQQQFLKSLGLLDRPSVEIPEVGTPMVPRPWREISTMTIAYGHGIAVSPLQMVRAYGVVVNGGHDVTPTLLVAATPSAPHPERVLSEHTSQTMRALLGLVVATAPVAKRKRRATWSGGKTGTAEKGWRRRLSPQSPAVVVCRGVPDRYDPRYVVFVALDEPKGTERTFNFASAGWTAAPTASRVVSRIAPLLGVAPTTRAPKSAADSLLVSVRKDQ